MIRNVLIAVISSTVTGTILFLFFLVIRFFTKKFLTNQWHYGILKIVMLLFIVPVVPIAYEVFSNTLYPQNFFPENMLPLYISENMEINLHELNNVYSNIKLSGGDLPNLYNVLFVVWIIGALIVLLNLGIRNYRILKTISSSSQKIIDEDTVSFFAQIKSSMSLSSDIKLYRSQKVSSPMLLGFIKPRVILPMKMYDKQMLRYIFCHELSHYRSKDIAIKFMILIVFIINWFNPLVYIFATFVENYQEMACDEKVIKHLNFSEFKQYANIILDSLSNQWVCNMSTVSLVNSKNNIKRRLIAIMNPIRNSYKRKALGLIIFAFILSFSFANVFAVYANSNIRHGDNTLGNIEMTNQSIQTINNEQSLTPNSNVNRTGNTAIALSWPISIEKAEISSGSIPGYNGIEVFSPLGTPIHAVASGTVIKVEDEQYFGYGKHIIIDHGYGYQSLYAYNNLNYVAVGDSVEQGDIIAEVGRSGHATDYSLYCEITYDGIPVDIKELAKP